MLTVVNLDSGRANYYLARSKVEYLQGEGAEGQWYGRGCQALGLSGTVNPKDFRSLFRGFLRGEALVQSAGKDNHIAGKDFALTVPKSVSCLYAVADRPVREAIERCHRQAVKRTLDYLEEKATVVRIGKGGRRREPAGMVTAIWQHGTNRAGEPNLHDHVTAFAIGVTSDGRTRSTDQMLYFVHKMAGGALYRCELAHRLETELGLQIYRPEGFTGTKKNWFEIAGVPAELQDRWSSRSRDIAREAAAKGLTGAVGKQIAALSTRAKKKPRPIPMPVLFDRWKKEAREHGFSQDSVVRARYPERDQKKELEEAVSLALSNVTQRVSHFAARDLVREVATEAQGRGLSASQVLAAVSETLRKSPEVVRLGMVKHEPRFSTREVFAIEERLLSMLGAVKGKNAHAVSNSCVERAIKETEKAASEKAKTPIRLTDEQRAGVTHLTRGQDAIAVLSAPAGAGKMLAATAAKCAFELDGYRCLEIGGKGPGVQRLLNDLSLTLFDAAKHHLKQLGRAALSSLNEDFKNTTVGGLLPRGKRAVEFSPLRVDAKTVVIVHEAELVSVKQMEELTRKAQEIGAKLCLISDPRKGTGTVAVSAVTKILGEALLTRQFRQQERADRDAIRAVAAGNATEALKSYAARGLLHVSDSPQDAIRQMVADWSKNGVQRPHAELLLCSSTQERQVLNRLAQVERQKAGKLGKHCVRCGTDSIYVGDRVTFQRNASFFGIERGSSGEVLRVGRQRITRKTFHGIQFRSLWSMLKYAEKVRKNKSLYVTVRLDTGQVLEIPIERYGKENLSLGYAATTWQARQMEVDRVFLLPGSSTSREELYSQVSRSRCETTIYTDRAAAGQDLEDLAKQAAKSRKQEMAHDILDHSREDRREQGR